jgi:protein required for attachment to host cells
MAMFPKGTMVIVADGEKAMILANEGNAAEPHLVVRSKREQDVGRNQDLLTDRPGRMPDPGAGHTQRSAMELPDPAREAREHFAEALAVRINKLKLNGAKLVIAAPPPLLAVIRDHLSQQVRDNVLAELPKTLTHHPLPKIGQIIAADIDAL